uniref:Cnidarian restricted protein n=1 Tax=Clytia hemisphaerica TaxID=252671 RepID=A0A7M5VAH2_9CNID
MDLTQVFNVLVMLWMAKARSIISKDYSFIGIGDSQPTIPVQEKLYEFCKNKPKICKDIIMNSSRNKKETDDTNTQLSENEFFSDKFRTVKDVEKEDQLFTQNEADEIIQNVFEILGYCIHNRSECPLLASHEPIYNDQEFKRAKINEQSVKSVPEILGKWCADLPKECAKALKFG